MCGQEPYDPSAHLCFVETNLPSFLDNLTERAAAVTHNNTHKENKEGKKGTINLARERREECLASVGLAAAFSAGSAADSLEIKEGLPGCAGAGAVQVMFVHDAHLPTVARLFEALFVRL